MIRLRTSLAAAAVCAALAACAPSLEPQLDPESRAFYQSARLVMTDEEEDIFRYLPDAESRREFIADFWARRNPDPTSPKNEFKEEFEKRIDYANKRFNEGRRGMDTDRGRIYVYLGPPDKTEFFANGEDGMGNVPILWWIYYRYELGVEFRDERNTGAYRMVTTDGNLLQAITEAKLGAAWQDSSAAGQFIDFAVHYDRDHRQLALTIPARKLRFKEEEGLIKVGFDFTFALYKPGAGTPEKSTGARSLSVAPEALAKAREMTFAFPFDLPPGKCYLDVTVVGRDGLGKSRKIFTIRN